ncbi:helix-turn-helix domain-containing protein, partial [Vibrio cholerae]|nr:helix-turn-helix domain-containing protein [Vibrio cholerae]
MSVKVMSYVWDISLFKGSDKLIMLCLADYADDAGVCWPSIETIARKSGVSSTTVKA